MRERTEAIASFAIAFDSANGNLYVANAGGNTISVISGKTNTVFGSPMVFD
jgi:DNA-binding beta-propeller fold protein YncE